MNTLYSVAQIRAIEQAAAATLPAATLMQRAGHAAARAALDLLSVPHGHARVLVLAGPGNNGGDALEVALRLAQSGVQVSVLQYGTPVTLDAQLAAQRAHNSPAQFLDPQLALEAGGSQTSSLNSTRWHLVVDGLFGIGLSRPILGSLKNLVQTVNHLPCPVLALDVPSGLDADTGNIVGSGVGNRAGAPDGLAEAAPESHAVAIRASHTITFIGNKPGLHTCDGRDYCGKVQVARLEIDQRHFVPSHSWLGELALFARLLQARPHNSHKGSYGMVAAIGGARGLAGALMLAGRAALYCGAGRVYAGFIEDAPLFDASQPELMCRRAAELDLASSTLLVGPGLGQSEAACQILAQALASQSALVLDADALNLIATNQACQQLLYAQHQRAILTPHPLEAARLLGISSAMVQADRPAAARRLADRFHCTVILKGSGSVIAGSHDKLVINTTGNPALASAGTGDVLAGVCAALLAQGWPEWESALAATWLHGRAADLLVEQGCGPIGLSAGELIPAIRKVFNQLVDEQAAGRQVH